MRLLGPGVLRIGGNSLDYSWWTSDDEQPPAWATSVVTPADLTRLRELLAITGWRVILGVDLGHFDPVRAAGEGHIAESILGSRLLGFEIGNEADDYGGSLVKLRPSTYGVNNYLQELTTYDTKMRAATPGISLFGPDLGFPFLQAWLPVVASDKDVPFTAITQHYYPTAYSVSRGVCKGTPVPTASELLSSQVRERENTILQDLVSAGRLAHRETRISETNTTASCDAGGGPATSPVFASALWSLDWALRSASAGVAGINFHGYLGRCLPEGVSPICAQGYAAERRGQVIARPEYYGLLAARMLEGGHFVPVDTAANNASADFVAYATVQSHRTATVAIDNFGHESLTPRLVVPGYRRAASEYLTAPSIGSKSGVVFGRASFSSAGVLRPKQAIVPKVDGAFHFELPPTSAVVITLHG
jgi:hypothetical protein